MAKSIIITGAGRGIGAATAHAFLDAGYRVGLIGRTEDIPVPDDHLHLAVAGLGVAGLHEDALRNQGVGQFIEQFAMGIEPLDACVVAVIAWLDGAVQ